MAWYKQGSKNKTDAPVSVAKKAFSVQNSHWIALVIRTMLTTALADMHITACSLLRLSWRTRMALLLT